MPGKVVRGLVIEVNLDPAIGSEPNKIRPCVVIQNDVGNKYSRTSMIAAITGAENVPRKYPVDVPVARGEGGLEKDSVIQCSLLRTVDEKRFMRTLGRLSAAMMRKVDEAIKISLGL